MKGFKAFEKGLICRGKQYAENTVFEEETAEICESGMHFCKNPLDVLDYYPLIDGNGEFSDFAEVEALDEAKTDDNKKYCTKKLKVGAKLSLPAFIKASVEVTYENIKNEVAEATKGKKLTDCKSGGDNATLAGGDNAKLAGGSYATLAGGKHSVMLGERGSKAKGKKGALIVLVEREYVNGEWIIKAYKAELVDGERIKEDTYYELENGEFVEA